MFRIFNPSGIGMNDKGGIVFPLMNGDVEATDLLTNSVGFSLNSTEDKVLVHVLLSDGETVKAGEITIS